MSLIPSIRQGGALDVAYDIARRLHGDGEDLIQKAVGAHSAPARERSGAMGPPRATEPGCGAEPHVSWTLREAGKIDPDRLERYLRTEGPRIPRTTVRYAIERFPPEEREALLKATRREANDGR